MDLQALTAADFAPLRGSAFVVTGTEHDGVELRLTNVNELPVQPNVPRPKPFTLVFAGPRQPLLVQHIYRLAHPELAELEIFLVPIGYDSEGGLLYEAVFN